MKDVFQQMESNNARFRNGGDSLEVYRARRAKEDKDFAVANIKKWKEINFAFKTNQPKEKV